VDIGATMLGNDQQARDGLPLIDGNLARGAISRFAFSYSAAKEAKGIPIFRQHNEANRLNSLPKKLVE
jgi:hypothetical protein